MVSSWNYIKKIKCTIMMGFARSRSDGIRVKYSFPSTIRYERQTQRIYAEADKEEFL